MIELPEKYKTFFDNEIILYHKQIERLKQKAIVAKNELFSEPFDAYFDDAGENEKIDFVNQFTNVISDLVLFPDKEVFDKLKSLKFRNPILKWFVPIDELLYEIEDLQKIDGLVFSMNHYLFIIQAHFKIKVFVSLMTGFGLGTTYNKVKTNIAFKELAVRYRRWEYNEKKMQTPAMNRFEAEIYYLYKKIEKDLGDSEIAKKYALKTLNGDTSLYYAQLNSFECIGISRRKVYCELFSLLKMILKDNEFFSYEEFANFDSSYGGVYDYYKIAHVKKILLKK